MTYAFYFDSGSCTGCKACQAACKDKNNLPTGVLWRRVYEVSGGEWTRTGEAWTNTVFAYNLSIACNHCVHPKCAGVCPADAYEVRPDGIVLINTQKCIGCGYCAWACPYDAPQVDKSAGVMTKCNLCFDYLDNGHPPACVAACPLRCLELVDIDDKRVDEMGQALWKIPGIEHPFPLPALSRTEPHLVIRPHPGLKLVGKSSKVSNREETSPSQPKVTASDEIPLIIFTLLVQMAIGAFGAVFFINLGFHDIQIAMQWTFIPFLAVGTATAFALIVSLFHLKSPKNAWRVLNHLRKSWLSREILFTLGFAGLWAIQAGQRISLTRPCSGEIILGLLTFICGLVALYSMQRVYQLRSMPGWNSIRTLVEFTISTIGLGCWLTGALLPSNVPSGIVAWLALAGILAFSASLLISFIYPELENKSLRNWQSGLLLAGIVGGASVFLWSREVWMAGWFVVLIIAFAEETIGRWLFYLRRTPGI
ncbi:MAG: DmsC/YnfH family molybdoenzyme membrane anchor subunit [Anaerolineales bacterium]